MAFELEDFHRNVSDGELIADLKRVASELGKTSVTRTDQNSNGKYHSATIVRRFGSWIVAHEKAGLQNTVTPLFASEESLFENLEDMWTKLGRQPRSEEICEPLSRFHYATYKRRFGNLRKALEAFVAYINNEERTPSGLNETQDFEIVSMQKGPRNVNWRLRFIVMRRDNFKCKVCGRTPANDPTIVLHVDHILAWAKGGRTVLENLQTLCSVCNQGKSDLDMQLSEVSNVAS
jgi:hypothetical protein